MRHRHHQTVLQLVVVTSIESGKGGVRLLEPLDRLVEVTGTVMGSADHVKVPGRAATLQGGFRPAYDLIGLDDGFGGHHTTAGQDVRDVGIAGPAFAPVNLPNERPIAFSVPDDQSEAGVLKPFLAVGRGG